MPKKPAKRAKRGDGATARKVVQEAPAEAGPAAAETASGSPGSGLDVLKNRLTGKRKAIFEILDDVKRVKPEQWQDPDQVEQLARTFASKLGLSVPEQRLKQFVNAYKDATKNGPNANVDELVKKYGSHVDDRTLKEIKKFIPGGK